MLAKLGSRQSLRWVAIIAGTLLVMVAVYLSSRIFADATIIGSDFYNSDGWYSTDDSNPYLYSATGDTALKAGAIPAATEFTQPLQDSVFKTTDVSPDATYDYSFTANQTPASSLSFIDRTLDIFGLGKITKVADTITGKPVANSFFQPEYTANQDTKPATNTSPWCQFGGFWCPPTPTNTDTTNKNTTATDTTTKLPSTGTQTGQASKTARVKVAANSWKWIWADYGSGPVVGKTPILAPYYAPEYVDPAGYALRYTAPQSYTNLSPTPGIAGVTVYLACTSSPQPVITKKTGSDGIVTITEQEALGLGCTLTNITASVHSVDGGSFPAPDPAIYNYYFPVNTVTLEEEGLPLATTPPKVLIGYRPTISGQITLGDKTSSGTRTSIALAGADVCIFYRKPTANEGCQTSKLSLSSKSDVTGHYMIYASWGDYLAQGGKESYMFVEKDGTRNYCGNAILDGQDGAKNRRNCEITEKASEVVTAAPTEETRVYYPPKTYKPTVKPRTTTQSTGSTATGSTTKKPTTTTGTGDSSTGSGTATTNKGTTTQPLNLDPPAGVHAPFVYQGRAANPPGQSTSAFMAVSPPKGQGIDLGKALQQAWANLNKPGASLVPYVPKPYVATIAPRAPSSQVTYPSCAAIRNNITKLQRLSALQKAEANKNADPKWKAYYQGTARSINNDISRMSQQRCTKP